MAGTVYLVGAGPGSPGLLTVRALQLLRTADVVLHDDLVTVEILSLVSRKAQVINVGKRCKHKRTTQEQINSLLVACAAYADVVVRLKCGDPVMFGRASEEVQALRDAGVEFEIVPGITAASAAAAAAQISLTNGRGNANPLLFMTAAQVVDRTGAGLRELLSNASIVVYMPGEKFGIVGCCLINAGVAPEAPCIIVSAASTRKEMLCFKNVRDLASLRPPASPALLIVGTVSLDNSGAVLHHCRALPQQVRDDNKSVAL